MPEGSTVEAKYKRLLDDYECLEEKHKRLRKTVISTTEDTVRPLIKRGEHEETPGFQNFAVFCPLCIVRGTGVCRTHIEVGYLVVARGTGWG